MTQPAHSNLPRLLDDYELTDLADRAAVEQAYQVSADHLTPLITHVAAAMLDDLRQAVQRDPDTVVVFLGRDGHSLAVAAGNLDPAFVADHCTEVVVSRAVVDAALQDLQANSGHTFPQLTGFRDAAAWVDPAAVSGARRNLTDYLQRSGVPVGEPGSSVVLVDTSFKGTVQELLAGIYPQTSFTGCYAFYGASPDDPHPGSKKGYAVHLEGDRSNGGRPLTALPDDPALTFGYVDAIGVVEYTLNGPLESPERISAQGPVQAWLRNDLNVLWGLNPIRVAEPYHHPVVREAAKAAMQLAVDERSHDLAAALHAGALTPAALNTQVDRLRQQIRSWDRRDPSTDPAFGQVMDAFVAHPDKWAIERLRADLQDRHLSVAAQTDIWRQFDRLDLAAKNTFTPGKAHVRPTAVTFPRTVQPNVPKAQARPGSSERPPDHSPRPRR